jgi:hypothetical protein
MGGVPAQADWLETSGDHFGIYSDQKVQSVMEFAERLERFDAVMASIYRKPKTMRRRFARWLGRIIGS